jgi:hypothetical protein
MLTLASIEPHVQKAVAALVYFLVLLAFGIQRGLGMVVPRAYNAA